MNLGILSRQASLYSTRRLKEAAVKRGHRVHIVDPLRCVMNISSGAPAVSYRGEQLHLDAIIPRIGASITLYGMAVVHQFEMMAVYTVAQSEAIGRSRDKLHALQLLAREGLGMPVTAFARSTLDTRELIQLVGGAPLVVKLTNGTQGKGVVLAETRKAAESVIDAFRQLDANILIQEFIEEAGGSDIRAFVVGSRVVAAMQRTAADGEFRSNLHRGGSARSVRLSKEERRTAVRAAKVMGLNVAGVDMLRSNRGPLLMEVNSSPGLEGIEAASGANVAEAIIEYIEDHAPASRRARR